jgi:hypothetical protein
MPEKQWKDDLSAQNERLRSEVIQFARLGAAGDAERVRIQALRFIRALRDGGDELAETLQAVVFSSPEESRRPGGTAPVRRAASAPVGISTPVPTDLESRLDLLRVEDPPRIPHAIIQDKQVLARLDQLVLERKSVARLAKLGLAPPKSVLFTGPPGVGKTMAARHVARQMGLPLLVLDLATVISSYLGKTGSNIKQAFAFARQRPCVFFLDEIDALAKRRDDDGDVGELKRLVTVLLQEIDLWSGENLLVAATNHEQLLDAAVGRRFDELIPFPRPGYDDLCRLAKALAAKDDPLPSGWAFIIALVTAGTSQSNFVKGLNRLRRAWVLGGKQAGYQALADFVASHVEGVSKTDRKRLGAALVRTAGASQRDASQLARIARNTLAAQLKQEA